MLISNTIKHYFDKVSEFGRDDAAGLYAFVDECAKKLGITESVTLVRSGSKNSSSIAALPERLVGGKRRNSIIISDGALELFNSTNLRGQFSDELKAIVAHEMSHIKDGHFHLVATRILPTFALPLAFAAGYYVLDKAYHEKKKDNNLSLSSAVKKVILDEKLGLAKLPEDFDEKDSAVKKVELYDYWLRLGGTVASAAVGLVAGVGLSRHLMLKTEFRADRVGGLLVHPDAMASALQKLTAHMEQNAASKKFCFKPQFITTSPDIETALGKLWQRLKSYHQVEKKMYDLEVLNAHPTLAQRTAALRELKHSPDFRARLDASPPVPGGIIP